MHIWPYIPYMPCVEPCVIFNAGLVPRFSSSNNAKCAKLACELQPFNPDRTCDIAHITDASINRTMYQKIPPAPYLYPAILAKRRMEYVDMQL